MTLDADAARRSFDALAVALLGITLLSASTRRLDRAIYLLAAQGLVLTLAAVVGAFASPSLHAVLAVSLTLAVKAVAVPGILLIAQRATRVRREMDVGLPYHLSLAIAVALVLLAYEVVVPLGPLDEYGTRNAVPTAVAMLLIGVFTMLVRRKALSQVAGLVTMENGIYLAALTATRGLPFAVELGIALDLLVGVAVMGLVSRQIHRAFETTDTNLLRTLRG